MICIADDPAVSRRIKKLVVEDARAMGMILIDQNRNDVPFDSGVFPYTNIGGAFEGNQILKYINSTK